MVYGSRKKALWSLPLAALVGLGACSDGTKGNLASGPVAGNATAGMVSSGGVVSSGGLASGGASAVGGSAAGAALGGAGAAAAGASGTATGGAATGGTVTGGAATGGATSAGAATGGAATGGIATTGGQAGGGAAGGGAGGTLGVAGSAGAGGASVRPPFALGADISSTLEFPMTYRDVDNAAKPLLTLLKNHGFNYIRLKTFVNPNAPYGYASTANGCTGFSEPFGDRDHIIAAGKTVKQAGMGFLLDFHYSDNWADPGNQIIPEAWRNASSISQLASLMKAYTTDVVGKAIAAGARPDMVQVGNEITAGMLKDIPGASTDCWGNSPAAAPFGGATSNWDNLATLLKAGIQGVRDADPTITVMLHIENTDDLDGVRWWVDAAQSRGVAFDVLGLSCYTEFQGQPSVWEATFKDLATRYPKLKFAIAEYNPERIRANQIMKALPDGRGIGTFFWEPTRSGEWGSAMFTFNGTTATAIAKDFAEFDNLRTQLGL